MKKFIARLVPAIPKHRAPLPRKLSPSQIAPLKSTKSSGHAEDICLVMIFSSSQRRKCTWPCANSWFSFFPTRPSLLPRQSRFQVGLAIVTSPDLCGAMVEAIGESTYPGWRAIVVIIVVGWLVGCWCCCCGVGGVSGEWDGSSLNWFESVGVQGIWWRIIYPLWWVGSVWKLGGPLKVLSRCIMLGPESTWDTPSWWLKW